MKLVNRADRDWRDLEALAAINSERAWLAITQLHLQVGDVLVVALADRLGCHRLLCRS